MEHCLSEEMQYRFSEALSVWSPAKQILTCSIFCPGGKCPGGYMSGGKCPGGTCPGFFCPVTLWFTQESTVCTSITAHMIHCQQETLWTVVLLS